MGRRAARGFAHADAHPRQGELEEAAREAAGDGHRAPQGEPRGDDVLSGYGFLTWGAAFLGRVHGLAPQQIGQSLGFIILFGGCAGAYLGGALADRLGRRDPAWYMRMPAIVTLLGLPPVLGFVWLESTATALACFAPFYLLANMYVGPLYSITQGVVRPNMRATASAILLFILNLVGLGAGPFAVGLLNDQFAARFGDEAIRYSLLLIAAIGGLAAPCFWLGSRALRADLAVSADA